MVLKCEVCEKEFESPTHRWTCGKDCKRELLRRRAKEQFADPIEREYVAEATRKGMSKLDMKAIIRTNRRSYVGENHPSYGMERTPEWREKISQANKGKLKGKSWDEIMGPERAAIRRVENSEAMIDTNVRLLNDRSSDLERYVAECLPEFQRNQKISKWVVDLVHPDVKIIIEVNGDYWHGNPKVYSSDTYINGIGMTVGEKNAADAYRNDQLRQMGYDVVVLWESDLKDRSPVEVRRMVREEVERGLACIV